MHLDSSLRVRSKLPRETSDPASVEPVSAKRARRNLDLPFSLSVLAAEIAAANARLERAGATRRISYPSGARGERERISKELFLALRETRDRRLFDLVYRLNRPLVQAYCRNRVRRGPERLNPIEILDDTFLLLWLRLDNFQDRPDSSFTGWVFAIAEHLALQAARVRRREARRERDLRCRAGSAPTVSEVDRVADAELAEARPSDAWLLTLLLASCLDTLPRRWRQVVELRDVEGRSYAEIAEALAVSRGCVAMLLRRARTRLFEELSARLGSVDGGRVARERGES